MFNCFDVLYLVTLSSLLDIHKREDEVIKRSLIIKIVRVIFRVAVSLEILV